ncbi:MAG: GNAT family N-acetyltransferase [Gemmatimonadetes bacterium]|nr:GNAT family N-acetyltransferase [Gemmatimonadota bacterium]
MTEPYQRRENVKVEIVDFRSEHAEAFRQMNLDWITLYWEVEDADRLYLENPRGKILEPGGAILMALDEGEAVGTVALISMGSGSYELAKMAVEERVRGRGIGWRLGRALLDRAREIGATRVYLESNTILEPAINLYRKLGFRSIKGSVSCYDRCNIQMEVWLAGGGPTPDPDTEPVPGVDSSVDSSGSAPETV